MSTNQSPHSHHGSILNTQQVAGLTVTENTYAPMSRLPRHAHKQACFCLVLEGSYTEIYQQKTLTCEPFSLIFRPAGETHSDHISRMRVRCFIIEFENGWLERVRQYAAGLNGPVTFQRNSLVWLAVKLRKEIKQMDGVTPLVIEGLMLEMLAEAARSCGRASGPGKPQWLERLGDILREQLTEHLTLSHLAQAVGVHPVYLAATFRRHYHCTVGEYVRRLRVESACRELSSSDAPLAQVALAAGFADQSQFSRTFKRLSGLTPTEYRRMLREP